MTPACVLVLLPLTFSEMVRCRHQLYGCELRYLKLNTFIYVSDGAFVTEFVTFTGIGIADHGDEMII